MKLKILFISIFLIIVGCKQSKKQVNTPHQLIETETNKASTLNTKEKKEDNNNDYNFDRAIKCQKYDYRPENIYSWGDYGCLYAPNDNNIYGNLIIYLIPKIGINKYYENYIGKEDENIDSEYDRVNNLSTEELKKEFHIYLSLIDKKYLEHTPNLDASYNIKQNEGDGYKFTTELYTFINESGKWKLLDSIETLPSTSRKAWDWEQEKIKGIIAKNQ